ncbi:BlaI/MecI/CopY family transcriptional regulator, partial [Alcanivorax sp. HI0044]|uniref:BlaI/MecI/CopY family transcriptional regulator n=3 Tax=Alcanivorax TaxID=59753 RepID=UPI000B1CA28B
MQLGELEKQVLQYFWKGRTADAKSVHSHFEKRRGGTLNTIQSTLDRLYKKGLLRREKQGHAFHY